MHKHADPWDVDLEHPSRLYAWHILESSLALTLKGVEVLAGLRAGAEASTCC